MLFAYWMVLIAALLPYSIVAFAKSAPGYDNHAPRAYLATLTGAKRRAEWAHQNHFEAFPPFAAGVVIASLAGVPHPVLNALAGGFVAARILYTAVYLADRAALRSMLFMIGLFCVIGLFVAAAFA